MKVKQMPYWLLRREWTVSALRKNSKMDGGLCRASSELLNKGMKSNSYRAGSAGFMFWVVFCNNWSLAS